MLEKIFDVKVEVLMMQQSDNSNAGINLALEMLTDVMSTSSISDENECITACNFSYIVKYV